jgi:hypothetical protein
MKNERGRTMAARRVRELLADTKHRIDSEASKELMRTVYVLDGGSALLVDPDGNAVLWYSYDRMMSEYRATLNLALERREPLSGLLPLAERFEFEVPMLLTKLPALLGIDIDHLNFSEQSLDAIDSAIRRLGSEYILTPQVFPSLTAYVGEVIRRVVNGSWEVRTTRDGTRHEPDIVDPAGGRYALLRIYKQLIEYGRTASMRTFVHAALRTHRLQPPH